MQSYDLVFQYVRISELKVNFHIFSAMNFNGLSHLGCLEPSSWSVQVILCIIHPGWLELPLARTNLHGPMPVQAIKSSTVQCVTASVSEAFGHLKKEREGASSRLTGLGMDLA